MDEDILNILLRNVQNLENIVQSGKESLDKYGKYKGFENKKESNARKDNAWLDEKKSLQDKNQTIQKKNDSLQEERQQLETQKQSLEKQVDVFGTENKQLKDNIAKLSEENSKMVKEMVTLKKEVESLKKIPIATSDESKNLKFRIEVLEKENVRLKEELDNSTTSLKTKLQQQSDLLQREKDLHEDEIAKWKKELNQMNDQETKFTTIRVSLEMQVSDLKKQINKVQKDHQEEIESMKRLHSKELDNLKRDSEVTPQQPNIVKNESTPPQSQNQPNLNDLIQENVLLRQKVLDLKNGLRFLTTRSHETLQVTKEELKKQLSHVENRYSIASQENSQLQTENFELRRKITELCSVMKEAARLRDLEYERFGEKCSHDALNQVHQLRTLLGLHESFYQES